MIHHLERIRQAKPTDGLLRVADIGSGVTFFPFSVARLGYDVTCIDVDPICAHDIPIAAKIIDHAPGKIVIGLMDGKRVPLGDESQDVVYCVSVLEHIPNCEDTIKEVARILKPGGQFVLTVDIDLRGDSELGVEAFELMQALLVAAGFKTAIPERVIHPGALLTTENSLYPELHKSAVAYAKQVVKNVLRGQLLRAKASVGLDLTVYGTVLEKT